MDEIHSFVLVLSLSVKPSNEVFSDFLDSNIGPRRPHRRRCHSAKVLSVVRLVILDYKIKFSFLRLYPLPKI